LSSTSQPIALSGYKLVRGTVSKDGISRNFAELQVVTSLAANRVTLSVTTPQSHSVFLIAII
jgi:hypothetical protein